MRYWRVIASFHKVQDVVVTVTAPNLTGGIRKGALAIKRLPQMKGKKLAAGSFMIQETYEVPIPKEPNEQMKPPAPVDGGIQAGSAPVPGDEGPEEAQKPLT